MTPKAALNTLLGLLLLICISAGFFAVRAYNKAIELRPQLDQLRADYNSLSAQYAESEAQHTKRTKQDQGIRDKRSSIQQKLKRTADETPAVADYLNQPIPSGVRDAFREDETP